MHFLFKPVGYLSIFILLQIFVVATVAVLPLFRCFLSPFIIVTIIILAELINGTNFCVSQIVYNVTPFVVYVRGGICRKLIEKAFFTFHSIFQLKGIFYDQ